MKISGQERALMESDHKRLEARSLALHGEIVKRLEENPRLVEIAKANLERWSAKDGNLAIWQEWREILNGPLPRVTSLLLSDDEDSKRLVQSSPFCGILTPRERWDIHEMTKINGAEGGT
jgi:hypothetical protein